MRPVFHSTEKVKPTLYSNECICIDGPKKKYYIYFQSKKLLCEKNSKEEILRHDFAQKKFNRKWTYKMENLYINHELINYKGLKIHGLKFFFSLLVHKNDEDSWGEVLLFFFFIQYFFF